ncbi:Uma2 family endonuclease [Streptomyces sp. NBC_01571]|uniref:Uma2 family endonuclease n=1 Tax=Streptomyces sp. NBC_01571 TaxID=2975883 RepID=UPI002252390D|nr:Uma2 family endonuclease [Streptomyces sp. NBC_01571]MCX4581475.1 Uma2 family endonuclease [Streptomyces sp. NBC_01571]
MSCWESRPGNKTMDRKFKPLPLVMSPAPGVRHQRASFRLHVILDAAARAAGAPVEVFEAINVTLPSGLVVPDLVVTDAGATAEDTVSVDADAVQLVIELVSFWRMEFDPAPRLIVSELQGGRYIETLTALAGTTTHIAAPFPVDIDPAGLARQ